jgi:Domain of unknown function (DUF4440)
MRFMAKILSALFVISFAFGVISAFGQELSAEQKEVWKVEEMLYEFNKQGDLWKYLDLYHNDGVVWATRVPHPINKPRMETIMMNYINIKSYKLEPVIIKVTGNSALAYFRFNYVDKNNATHSGRMVHFLIKQDGKWRIFGGSEHWENP